MCMILHFALANILNNSYTVPSVGQYEALQTLSTELIIRNIIVIRLLFL